MEDSGVGLQGRLRMLSNRQTGSRACDMASSPAGLLPGGVFCIMPSPHKGRKGILGPQGHLTLRAITKCTNGEMLMSRLTVSCVLAALCGLCFAQTAAPIDWSLVYKAESLPNETGWGRSAGESTSAEITPDGLRLVDAGTQHTQLHCYSRSWGAQPGESAIVQATVKLVACSGVAGMCIHTSDGIHEDCLTLYPDRIELSQSGLKYAMDTTDAFHTYQIRIAGTTQQVFVDGELVIDGWGAFRGPAYHGRCVVQFGSISSAATGEAVFKEVRYAVSAPRAQVLEDVKNVIIYRKEGIYACFPSLLQAQDGGLFTSFGTRSRRSHIDPTGGSAQAMSADGGHTWQPVDAVPSDPRYVRQDGTKIQPRARGWVYVSDDKLEEIKQAGRTWMRAKEGTIAYLGDPEVVVTTPEGDTRTIKLDGPTPAGVMAFHDASSFIRKDALWLIAIYGHVQAGGDTAVWGIRSQDDGETWQVVQIAAPQPGIRGFNETAICDNGKGEIIAVMRPEDQKLNSYQCFSSDGGKTWSTPVSTGFWGYPSNLLLLRDGRLLCTYGYRRAPMGIRAMLSEDGGHTWDLEHPIVLRADAQGHGGDNGYPISVQMQDGHVFTIYYINDNENVTHVAGTNWELPSRE